MKVVGAITEVETTFGPDSYAGTWMNFIDNDGVVHSYKAGNVVRMNNWNAFADAVILGFDKDGNARLARPYLYASLVGTTAPSPMLGYETIDRVAPELLAKHWKKMNENFLTR